MGKWLFLIIALCCSCHVKRAAKGNPDPRLNDIQLPPGFRIEIFAENIKNARSLCRTENGLIIVGTRKEGNVYVLNDKDGDFKADEVITLFTGLNSPNGVAIKNGDLYIAEIDKVSKVIDIEKNYKNSPKMITVNDDFPNDGYHGWKYIAFGPDGKLYVPVGVPCNICESDSIYGTILRMNDDGSEFEIYAKGIRNTVGFDWHPDNGELWFTDNGRDWMTDTLPPDELNRITHKGQHFGFPYCHAGYLTDPKFGDENSCDKYIKPEMNLGPHVAALGMEFYSGKMFPKKYKNYIFIAEHGSWNSATPMGYRVTMVKLENNKAVSYEPFITGWLKGNKAWGRPVDILELPDGSLLVSDDFADMVYRISYGDD